MPYRLQKFRQINSTADQLQMRSLDRIKLLAAAYLSRLRERIPAIPRLEFVLRFPYENTSITYCIRSNDVDFRFLGEIFANREYAVPAVDPKRILNLGGNIGSTDIFFHSSYPKSEIITVEPLPDNLRLLRKNLELNGVRAKVIPAAASNKSGKAQFFVGGEDNSSLIERGDMSTSIEVNCVTVPDIMRDAAWESIDILKVDIEGGEKELFRDSGEWIGKVGMIIAELHNGYSIDEFDADTGGQFQCRQVFEYPPPACMVGVLAIRKN